MVLGPMSFCRLPNISQGVRSVDSMGLQNCPQPLCVVLCCLEELPVFLTEQTGTV